MNYRNMLIASLLTGIVASCSLLPKDKPAPAVPDISELETDRTDLVEVSAKMDPMAHSFGFSSAPMTEPPATVTRRNVEFVIGDEGPATATPSVSDYTEVSNYTGLNNGPARMAPNYPERPVPKHGMTPDMVVADLGQPPHKIPGNSGAEVWDYGTFRVFFQNEQVAFTRVW